MFQTITIIGFVIVLGGIAVHFVTLPSGAASAMASACRRELFGFWDLSDRTFTWFGRLKRLAVWVAFACLLVLTLTGFIPPIFYGDLLGGYALILHASAAPVFMVTVAFIALVWAHSCRFNRHDWDSFFGVSDHGPESGPIHSGLGWKLSFWVASALAIPVSLSILLGMYPIFGTHDQEVLLSLHRYTSLALVLSAMTHLYLVIHARSAVDAARPVAATSAMRATSGRTDSEARADAVASVSPPDTARSTVEASVQNSSLDASVTAPESASASTVTSADSSSAATTGRKRATKVSPKKKAGGTKAKSADKSGSRTPAKKRARST